MKEALDRFSPKAVGAMVRHMRKEADLTRDELGEKLGLHGASITRIERGTHALLVKKLFEAAKACGFSIRLSIEPKVK